MRFQLGLNSCLYLQETRAAVQEGRDFSQKNRDGAAMFCGAWPFAGKGVTSGQSMQETRR